MMLHRPIESATLTKHVDYFRVARHSPSGDEETRHHCGGARATPSHVFWSGCKAISSTGSATPNTIQDAK